MALLQLLCLSTACISLLSGSAPPAESIAQHPEVYSRLSERLFLKHRIGDRQTFVPVIADALDWNARCAQPFGASDFETFVADFAPDRGDTQFHAALSYGALKNLLRRGTSAHTRIFNLFATPEGLNYVDGADDSAPAPLSLLVKEHRRITLDVISAVTAKIKDYDLANGWICENITQALAAEYVNNNNAAAHEALKYWVTENVQHAVGFELSLRLSLIGPNEPFPFPAECDEQDFNVQEMDLTRVEAVKQLFLACMEINEELLDSTKYSDLEFSSYE